MRLGHSGTTAASALLAVALAILAASCGHRRPADYTEAEALAYLEARGYAFTPEELTRSIGEDALDVSIAFLGAGIDPDASDGRALGVAAGRGDVEMVRLLLDAGADPDLGGGSFGQVPLVTAVMRDRKDVVESLLEAGADPNARPPGAATALHFAKDAATARLLLDAGADTRAADARGTTPLMGAIVIGDPGLVDLLLERGADPSQADRFGRTPLLCAKVLRFAEIERRLLAAGARELPRLQIGMATLQSYAGRYGAADRGAGYSYQIVVDPGRLLLIEVRSNGALAATDLLPLDATTFYRAGDPGLVLFRIEIEDGRATGLSVTEQSAWRTLPRLEEDSALERPPVE